MQLPFKTKLSETQRLYIGDQMRGIMEEVFGKKWEDDDSLRGTPLRFAKYLAEYRQPIDIDKIFGSVFVTPEKHPGIVVQTKIPFRMTCEHHLLPATGRAALAYIPHERVLGLSKLARLVDAVGVERPSLQEHIAHRVLDLMEEHLKPKGVMIVIRAEHGCMACRGINKPGVNTITSHIQGVFRDNPEAKKEAMQLIMADWG